MLGGQIRLSPNRQGGLRTFCKVLEKSKIQHKTDVQLVQYNSCASCWIYVLIIITSYITSAWLSEKSSKDTQEHASFRYKRHTFNMIFTSPPVAVAPQASDQVYRSGRGKTANFGCDDSLHNGQLIGIIRGV